MLWCMQATLHCPACGSGRLTPETAITDGEDGVALTFAKPASARLLSLPPAYEARRGRACADCGYVMLFLAPDDVTAIDQRLDGLTPRN